MIVQTYGNQIPIVIIRDILKPKIIQSMIDEILSLHYSNQFKTGELTNSADDGANNVKSNFSVFLDDVYQDQRQRSKILSVHEKIINKALLSELGNKHPVFEYYKTTNFHSTLVNIYRNNNNYFSHQDSSVITSMTYLWNSPKHFEGGEVFFEKYNITYNPELGDVLVFPGFCYHEVLNVTVKDDDVCNSRFSISQFFSIT